MSLQIWFGFLIASWLICLSPGPGALSSITAGMRHGFRRALWNVAGLEVGSNLMLLTVAAGLGAALAASAVAFIAIKWLGVAYLIYLGIQQWRAPPLAMRLQGASPEHALATPRALFSRGVLVNLSNPKGILFYLAVLPQFIDPQTPQLPQYVIVAATLTVTDMIVMALYTALGARALRWLRDPSAQRWSNRGFGGLFVGAGLALATFRHAV